MVSETPTLHSSDIDIHDEAHAFEIARRLADEVFGTFEVEYYENKDHGDYGPKSPLPFRAAFHDDDWKFSTETFGETAGEALLRAVKLYLLKREVAPQWLAEDERLIAEMSGEQARATLLALLTQNKPYAVWPDRVRKAANLPLRKVEGDDDE